MSSVFPLLLAIAPSPAIEPADRGIPEPVALAQSPAPVLAPAEPIAPAPPPAPVVVRADASSPMVATPSVERHVHVPDPDRIAAVQRRLSSFAIGYDNGLWGSAFGQGVRIEIPFGRKVGQFFGVRLRTWMVHAQNEQTQHRYDPVISSGADFFGRGPVLLGILRVYGGGGPRVGVRPMPHGTGSQVKVSGGGQLGVEFLLSRRVTAQFEVGGQGNTHALGVDAGATVQAGCMVYLGGESNRRYAARQRGNKAGAKRGGIAGRLANRR